MLLTLIGRYIKQSLVLSGLTIVGIALGIAVFLSIYLTNQSALSQFKANIADISGSTNIQITAKAAPHLNERVIDYIHWVWETHTECHPVIEHTMIALPPTAQGTIDGDVMQVLGVDMITDSDNRQYDWSTDGKPADLLTILHPNHAFISSAYARQHSLHVGDTLPVLVNDQRHSLTISGIFNNSGLGRANPNIVLMDVSTAQPLFGMTGMLTRLDCTSPEATLTQVEQRLKTSLPGYATVSRPMQRSQQLQKMVRAFQTNLQALSVVSLLVGMFLIYNTLAIAVVRRRTDIGTLRALGLSRRQLLVLFISEATLLGLLGTALGCAFGIGLAHLTLGNISATMQVIYTGQPVTQITISWQSIGLALFMGLGLTNIAAIPPLLDATGQAPAMTQRKHQESALAQLRIPLFNSLAVLLLGATAICLTLPTWDDLPVFGYIAALLMLLAISALMPWFARSLTQVILWMRPPWLLRLSTASLQQSLARTSIALASLMTGIALMTSLAVLIGSFRTTVVDWVHQSLRADVFIEPEARALSKNAGSISPALMAVFKATPGVVAVDDFADIPITYQGLTTRVGAGQSRILSRYGYLRFVDGSDHRAIIDQLMPRPNQSYKAVVSESFANRFHVKKHQTVTLDTPTGPLPLQVLGIYYDYASEMGYIVFDKAIYQRFFQDNTTSYVALYVSKNADSQAIRSRLIKQFSGRHALSIRTNRELRAEVLRIFDQTFAITNVLHVIAMIIAFLCIINTLFTLVLESRRDFAVLSVMGIRPHELQLVILGQALLLGFMGWLSGIVAGFGLSALLIQVINKQSFGWTIQLQLPLDFLIQSFALVMLSALASAIIPALTLHRQLNTEVLRDE